MNYIKPPSLSTSFSETGKSAKKRFDNILNPKARKTGAIAFLIILALVGTVGTIVACNHPNKIIYESKALGISFEIPKSWDGKYGAEENESSVVLYHKGTRETYGEGTGALFYIERLEGTLTQEEIEEPGNRMMILQASDYTYVFGTPTDVQYPAWEGGEKALVDEYLELAKGLENMKKSIKTIAVSASPVLASNTKRLYALKDTYIGDNAKVHEIADAVNFAGISIQSIALKTDSKPYVLTVNYKVGSRANYRFFDYSAFQKNAAVMFCLIPNMDEINFRIYDNYASEDDLDTSFASAYYNRQNLSERVGMEYFNEENVRNAPTSIERFADYLDKVSAVNPETYYDTEFKGNTKQTQIYRVIGENCEIVTNSGLQYFITITKAAAADKDLNALLKPANIDLDDYIAKQMEFTTYAIRNFKTGQITSYLFVFDGQTLIAYEDLKTPQMDRTVMDILRTYEDRGI